MYYIDVRMPLATLGIEVVIEELDKEGQTPTAEAREAITNA